MVEYESLVLGLNLALEWKLTTLKFYEDSQLVINQVTNMYQTKDEKLLPYKHMVDTLKAFLVHITFEKIHIDKNRVVDPMSTLASLL